MEKTENSSIQIEAIVKSPSRDAHLRNGVGFSLGEIKSAGINVQMIKNLGVKIDFFRKSIHDSNIELLKKLRVPEKKGKKRAPFVHREKNIRVRAEKVKKKAKPVKDVKEIPKKTKIKAKKIPKKKIKPPIEAETVSEIKEELKEIPKEKIVPLAEEISKEKTKSKDKKKAKKKTKVKTEEIGTPLTSLTGLGSTTAKKFVEVGVNSVEELIEENPEELVLLISGVSEERLKKWIDEGKVLLNK
jgi:large subunit ribosomal protein L13e